MNHHLAGIIIGGLMPALILGGFGVMQKTCLRAGLGLGPFFVITGGTIVVFGLVCCLLSASGHVSLKAGFYALAAGLLWALGTGLILLSVSRFGASISQLAPLYNMNTLVVVLLGLLVFSEWQQVRPAPLWIGTVLIVLGALFVARA